MKLTRRAFAAAAMTVLIPTGCAAQSGGGSGGSDGSGASDGSAAAGDQSFPQTVTTAFGDVTVDAKPSRVVALGWGDAETALALGVQPVGASDWLGFGGEGVGPWAQGLYTSPPTIIDTLEPSYEAIAALKPDLILDVKSSGDKDRYEKLSEIATTIGVPEGGESYLTTTNAQMTMISTALGMPDKGAELLDEVNSAFEAAASAHPEWKGKTVTAATKTSEGWGAYIEGGGRVDTLSKFGFVQNPQIAALPVSSSGFSVDVSSEQLDLFDADLIVAFPIYIETTAITDDPQWKQLSTVQAGHAVVIDGDLSSAFSTETTLSSKYTIEGLVPLLEKAVPAS
ncbi:iron-siderophore ABC transporter substrate-binding protein [Brachybacterium huguangmaarense]|uniref:Iron-siderophore ABC transporter substrate-binding protein n=1 Tax=Brachybacterium huguangmaarense TaxID=1652028 RepID=A0ABY6G5L8_9MICO|nr:iron-siderophore ABC transporter substrate-binding protein [Brachybacterium huguangmaarense]UYG17983.1 iron-siderophore ABC transporter substrate-binding protein [Brachybacterium huguangmaarense]